MRTLLLSNSSVGVCTERDFLKSRGKHCVAYIL